MNVTENNPNEFLGPNEFHGQEGKWFKITFKNYDSMFDEGYIDTVILQYSFTELNSAFYGGYRFVFNSRNGANWYLFSHDIESYEMIEAPPPLHEPMELQIFYKGEVYQIESDLLNDWNFNQNASRDAIASRILTWVNKIEPN